jgi:hypothetical protein
LARVGLLFLLEVRLELETEVLDLLPLLPFDDELLLEAEDLVLPLAHLVLERDSPVLELLVGFLCFTIGEV